MAEQEEGRAARILIVEDEMMVSMLLEDLLEEFGYEIVGPATDLEKALAMAGDAEFEAAILDVNMNGRDTYAVAETLRQRGIPFVFATGYGAGGLAEPFRDTPTLSKPFLRDELRRVVSEAVRRSSSRRRQ